MNAVLRKLTYADLAALPEDNLRHEILDGKHYVSSSPGVRHQAVLANLFAAVDAHVRAKGSGMTLFAPVDVLLSEHDVLVPDMLYVAGDCAAVIEAPNLRGVPDLVVEVLSPSTQRRDVTIKRRLYQQHGVAEYWIVDPRQETVTVCRGPGDWRLSSTKLQRGQDTARLTSPLFPDLALPLDEIFA